MKQIFFMLARKIFKIIHINPACIMWLVPNNYIDISEQSAAIAMEKLEAFSPNPKTSCIRVNSISEDVDVHIIVPAYNVEKYICDCVDSVVNAAKTISWHMTIINDGSTDNTGALLNKYENIPEVEIIHQENRGFSGARNRGLENIKGKYIFFLDSDDMACWDGIEEMMKIAKENNAQIVQGGYYVINEQGRRLKKVCKKTEITGHPWGKLFIADLFSNLKFPENYWYEDSIIHQIVLDTVNQISFTKETTYFYRTRKGNITSTSKTKPKCIDTLYITLQLHDIRNQLNRLNSTNYYDYILRMVYLSYHRIAQQNDDIIRWMFVVFSKFVTENFNDISTNNHILKPIEDYLKTGNYTKLKTYCELICL